MASPPIPPEFSHLSQRSFSFFPPILNIEHNEWLLSKATWSEILVINCQSHAEVWIPRRYVGEIAPIEDPVIIVGLNLELEWKGGMIVPNQRRIIAMPMAVRGSALPAGAAEGPHGSLLGIRLERSDRMMLKLVGMAVTALIVLYLVAVNFTRVGDLRQGRVTFTATDQAFLDLNSRDDVLGVSQKLGKPAWEREKESGTIIFHELGYPNRKYSIILMGRDKGSLVYIGAMDDNWRPVHSVNPTTDSLLRSLPRF